MRMILKEKVGVLVIKQIILLCGLCMFFVGQVNAAEPAKPLNFFNMLNEVFEKNPNVQASMLQVDMRTAERNQLEGVLDTRFGGSVGLSDEVKPTTSPFAPSGTSLGFVAGQVVQPFSDGSSLTGTLKYNKSKLTYPNTVNPAFQSSPNPTYQHQIDLIYRYPLVGGAGNPNYHYQKEAGEDEIKAAQLRIAVLKEQLTSQAIGFYAQFILNDLSVKLAQDATLRAEQLLNNQKSRENFGLAEKEDRLQTEALLSMRQFQQVQAMATRDASQTALNRLMHQDGNILLSPKLEPLHMNLRSVADMLDAAEQRRPVFKVLDAQYAAAQARLAMVEAAGDYQLDLVGQVGTRALDGSAGGALVQGFTIDDRYIGLQVEFSDVWGHKANRAAIQSNVLALENIKIERKRMHEDLETELAITRIALLNGEGTLQAALRQVEAEKKKYNGELARYKRGRSSTAVITQFEGDLSAARLRALIQQVNVQVAEYKLALALGELLPMLPNKQAKNTAGAEQ